MAKFLHDNNPVRFGQKSQRIYSADSNRTIDDNNFLIITDCILTSEAVNEYSGKQIADYEKWGLDPEKSYAIYRPLTEIEKAKETYNLRPLTDDHIAITPERPAQDKTLGTTGEKARIEGGDLLNTVAVWVGKGQQYIEDADKGYDAGKKDLSCGYAYKLRREDGVWNGKRYEFIMYDLRGNHVALVKEGRVERASIADSAENLEGAGTVKKKSGMRLFLDHYFGDSKAKDNEEKMKDNKEIMRSMKEISGKDAAEFEGGESEKGKTIMEMASKLHDMDPDDDMIDNEHETEEEEKERKRKEKEAKDKKAHDNEEREDHKEKAKDKKGRDNKEREDHEAEDYQTRSESQNTEKKVFEANKRAAMDSLAFDEMVNRKINETIQVRHKVIKLCTDVIGTLPDELLMDSNLENIVNHTLRLKGQTYQDKNVDVKLAMLEVLRTQTSAPRYAMDKANNYSKPTTHTNPSIFNAMKGK